MDWKINDIFVVLQSCVVCGDDFEQFFDEESEEWHLKNALRSAGKVGKILGYIWMKDG